MTKTRYFIDFEFMEDGRTIDPLSLGIVCNDGRELYLEFVDVDLSKANDWVCENVIPHLVAHHSPYGPPPAATLVRRDADGRGSAPPVAWQVVYDFIMDGTHEPEFWGYYADYDWVTFCQLFGTMMDLPRGWPKYCHDIKQLQSLIAPELDLSAVIPNPSEHHALADARWNMLAFDRLYQEVLEPTEVDSSGIDLVWRIFTSLGGPR